MNKELKRRLARIRAEERKKHFENGGEASTWRGGKKQVTRNRKKEKSRRACRGKRYE